MSFLSAIVLTLPHFLSYTALRANLTLRARHYWLHCPICMNSRLYPIQIGVEGSFAECISSCRPCSINLLTRGAMRVVSTALPANAAQTAAHLLIWALQLTFSFVRRPMTGFPVCLDFTMTGAIGDKFPHPCLLSSSSMVLYEHG